MEMVTGALVDMVRAEAVAVAVASKAEEATPVQPPPVPPLAARVAEARQAVVAESRSILGSPHSYPRSI